MSIPLIRVYDTFLKPDGTPDTGQISFMLSADMVDGDTGTIYSTSATVATLDATGSFSLSLPATDYPNSTPLGVQYIVTENVGRGRSYRVPLAYNTPGAAIKLSALAPAPSQSIIYGLASITATDPIIATTTGSQVALSHNTSGAAAGSGYGSLTVDARGHVTGGLKREYDIRNYGALCNGVANDAAAIAAAITAAAVAGGTVLIPGRGLITTYASAITLATGVQIVLQAGATLRYTGTGNAVTCDAIYPVAYGGLVGEPGSIFDFGTSAGIMFNLISTQFCTFGGFLITSNNAANTIFSLTTSCLNNSPLTGNANLGACTFRPTLVLGACGTGIYANGYDAAHVKHTPVTLNHFEFLDFDTVCVAGIVFQRDVDDNIVQFARIRLRADNAIGVQVGDPAALSSVNNSVYANQFFYLAVACFAGSVGRSGVVLNVGVKAFRVSNYYNNPPAELGEIINNGALSYEIIQVDNNYISKNQFGVHYPNGFSVAESAFFDGTNATNATFSVDATNHIVDIGNKTVPVGLSAFTIDANATDANGVNFAQDLAYSISNKSALIEQNRIAPLAAGVTFNTHFINPQMYNDAGSLGFAAAYGLRVAPTLLSTFLGTLAEWRGIYISNASIQGGAIGTQYGIYIDNLSGATNSFGIFVASATTSRFAGPVQLTAGYLMPDTTHHLTLPLVTDTLATLANVPLPLIFTANSAPPYTTNIAAYAAALPQDVGATITRWDTAYAVTGTNNGTNYWTVILQVMALNGTLTNIASFNTSANAGNTWYSAAVTAFVGGGVVPAATYLQVVVTVTPTGTPGSLSLHPSVRAH